MSTHDATIEKTLFIGSQRVGGPIPLPYDELLVHHAAVRDAIANAMHMEHAMNQDLKSLVAAHSFVYAFNAYKALGLLLPELYHESGSVILRQLWEVALNLHWIENDPDNRAQAFCGFTLIENRKLIMKSGNAHSAELAAFDKATAAYQARFRFQDRNGKEKVRSDFSARNVAERASDLGEPWKREYELVYHLASMHTHGSPGAVMHALFRQHYSSPEVRERNSAALFAIVAIRVMVRVVRLLVRLGFLDVEKTAEVETCFSSFEETVQKTSEDAACAQEPSAP